MAIITPSTDLILLKCPLEIDQANQITFTSYDDQARWFQTLPKLEVTNFTYQRKDGTVRFPSVFEDIRNYNYCMYKNVAYANKWFYCFIEKMTYVNDEVTEIKLVTDVWQTWQMSLTYKQSFVEREHTTDDSIGANTLDEGLTTGEYIINAFTNKTICAPDTGGAYIVLSVTESPKYKDGTPVTSEFVSRVYNGIIQGTYLYLFDYNNTGTASLSQFIKWYDTNGKGSSICSVYAIPKTSYPAGSVTNHTINSGGNSPFTATVTFHQLVYGTGATDMGTTNLSINGNLNGYTPKNNKLFCFPYNYILATNNHGVSNVYHWEDFSNPSSVTFKYNGVVTEGSSVKAYPVNYKKNNTNFSGYSFGLDMQATPTFSWTNDMYLNWKAQNSWQGFSNQADNLTGTFMNQPSGGAQAPAGDVFSYFGNLIEEGGKYIGSAINAITNTVSGASYKASLLPDQVNGQTTGDVNFAIGRCGFTYYKMSVRYEIARIIDEYFTMYGYKVARVKHIRIHTRRYWNYLKCVKPNILGDIPQEDMNQIKSMFTAGITLWHDPSKYLDYSQNNTIL